MEFDQTEILEKFRKSPGGLNVRFIPVSETVALKLARCATEKSYMLQAYNLQKMCAEHGLAPDVIGDFLEINDQERSYYGYFTEIVEIMPTNNVGDLVRPEKYFTNEQAEEFRELMRELKELGVPEDIVEDSYECNVGFKNGKMVQIDFF